MKKMVFNWTTFLIAKETKRVWPMSHNTEIHEFSTVLTPEETVIEFNINAKMIAEDFFGIVAMNHPCMHIEYCHNKNLFGAEYRLAGDFNEDTTEKNFDKVLIVNATAFML